GTGIVGYGKALIGPGHERNSNCGRSSPRRHLVSHARDAIAVGADEGQPRFTAAFPERAVFGEKPVTGVNRVAFHRDRSFQRSTGVRITGGCCRRADTYRVVGGLEAKFRVFAAGPDVNEAVAAGRSDATMVVRRNYVQTMSGSL